jgi:hypothetical protein
MIGELARLEIAEAMGVNPRRALSCACGLTQGIPGYRGDVLTYGGAVWTALRAQGLPDAQIQAAGLAALQGSAPAPAEASAATPAPPPVAATDPVDERPAYTFEPYPGAPSDLTQRILRAVQDLGPQFAGQAIEVPRDLMADYRPNPLHDARGRGPRLQMEIYRRLGALIRGEPTVGEE